MLTRESESVRAGPGTDHTNYHIQQSSFSPDERNYGEMGQYFSQG